MRLKKTITSLKGNEYLAYITILDGAVEIIISRGGTFLDGLKFSAGKDDLDIIKSIIEQSISDIENTRDSLFWKLKAWDGTLV